MNCSLRLVLVFLCRWALCYGQEILGCGGFVKSDVTIDFSQIEIQLLTSEGMLKYQTECAPNNGYFMVPFVDKGDFMLKIRPPEGWLFEPMSVDLHVDGINDPCTKGKDINFVFKGFTLSGQVLSVGSSSGPAEVTVALNSVQSGKTLMETQTSASGAYAFEGVPPGKYDVVASHQTYSFKQHRTEVTVAKNNGRCQNDIIVSGFDVHGYVTAQSLPVAGVHLLLFASNAKLAKEVKGCSAARPAGAESVLCDGYPHYLCSVSSGDDGKYTFPSLPPAQYSIVPFHRGERIQFDVEPRELRFSVSNARVTHEKSFEVTGFSVQGRVLDGKNGKPVKGASVVIDGKKHDTTDNAGYYTLQHMHSGVFEVTVLKEDVQFPQAKMRIGPDTPILPDIVASSFSLCGKIEVVELPGKSSLSDVAIAVSSIADKSSVKKTNADATGAFCMMLQPGSYSVEPVLTKQMVDDGLVLTPKSVQVKILNLPRKDLSFKQYRGSVTVELSCIEACENVKVELSSTRTSKKTKQNVNVTGKKAITQFRNVLPGKYTASVHHDDWCWTSESATVTVSPTPKDEPSAVSRFEQSGYKLVCSISHDIELKIHYGGVEVNSFPLKKGHNRMCLARPGEYTLEPVSCHRFDVTTPLKYNTARPKPITLHAVAHEAIIAMETTLKINDDSSDATTVMIRSSRGKVTKKSMKLVPDGEDKAKEADKKYLYKLSHWASDNEELEVTPSSKLLLFEPSTAEVAMRSGACSEELVRFRGVVGRFLEGKISPPIANIDLTVTAVGMDKGLALKTDTQGKYRVGPLHPDFEYEISASMEDYVMTPDEKRKGDFVAKKLSKLIFKILTEDGSRPLPGVLLSISGGDYRSNNLTGSDGTLTLTKLEPAQYYFKAMMKEYQFNPSSQVIEIQEGAKTVINISGKRVAYSATGTVTSLNGEPESGVTVRAVARPSGDKCAGSMEESESGADGYFRIRGLRPGCQYDIAVRVGAQRFSHVSPELVTVTTKEEDTEGFKFIAFRQLSTFDLSGNVVTPNEFLPFIKMVLCRTNDSGCGTPIHTALLSRATPFFHFPTLARDDSEYVLKLECTLARSMYSFTEPAAGFFAAGPHKHITFRFEPQAKKVEAEVPQVSILTLPVTLLVILLAYNRTKAFAYVQTFIQKLSGRRDNGLEVRYGRRQKK